MKDVLFVTTSDLSGRSGHNIATREMVKAFARHPSTRLTVVCPEPDRPAAWDDCDVEQFVYLPRQDFSLTGHVRNQIRLVDRLAACLIRRPDLVVGRLDPAFAVLPVLTKLFGVDYSLHIRGDVTRSMRFTPVVWGVVALNVFSADSIVAETDHLADKLVRRFRPNAPLATFNSAVDTDLFRPISRAEARERIDPTLPDESFIIGFIGSLKRRHNVGVLLEAIRTLSRRDADVFGLIVGDGPLREHLERQAADLGIEGLVRFEGFVPHSEVAWYICASDVLYAVVDPTTKTNPLKCYESLACGRPIITTREEELRFVESVDAGVLVEEITVEEVTHAILEARDAGENELRRMGERGRQYVVEHNTWDRLPEITLDLAF
jgi:glycosyltransferase involved in cell wall biosynthesis